MIKVLINITLLSFCCLNVYVKLADSKCANKFSGKVVTAAGDWSNPQWNETDPLGKMTLDDSDCNYYLVINNLKTDTTYNWKVSDAH
jgi:hypothetical protein